jgi:uncharacterized membrane protein YdjX (TVP38/TMEM64 family)
MVDDLFSRLQSASWLSAQTGLGPVAILFCLVLVSQIFLFPISPLSIYAGFTFGFWTGTSWILLAKMCSAFLNFSISRWIAPSLGKRLASRYPLVQSMDEVILQEGLVFTILLRLCPMPFGLANYAYGLTRMPFLFFGIATFVSILLPSITLCALGSSLNEGLEALKDGGTHRNTWQLIASAVSILAVILVARRITFIVMKRVSETKASSDLKPPLS